MPKICRYDIIFTLNSVILRSEPRLTLFISKERQVKFLSDDAKNVVENAINTAVSALGEIEIVEIRYSTEYGKDNLTVFIWSPDGVDLDKCENVHNAVSDVLDGYEDLFPEDYVLNVSSSGLDRPIVTDDDFRRALGTEIEITADKKKFHGTLTSYDSDNATILTDGKSPKEITFSRNNIKAKPYIRF